MRSISPLNILTKTASSIRKVHDLDRKMVYEQIKRAGESQFITGLFICSDVNYIMHTYLIFLSTESKAYSGIEEAVQKSLRKS